MLATLERGNETMLNVYDVIAIGVVSLATITVVKMILDFLHTTSVNRTFRKAMEQGVIRPMDEDTLKREMLKRALERYKQSKEGEKQ